jgi:hypothetical protein
MTQKNTQTNTNSYDANSLASYNQLQPVAGKALGANISDPFSNSMFNTQLGMGNQQIATQGGSDMNSFLQRQQANGMNPNSGTFMQNMNRVTMNNSNQRAGLFGNLLLGASNLRSASVAGAANYRPLQTGGTGTQTVGGTGSWLPQLVATGLGAAAAAFPKPQDQTMPQTPDQNPLLGGAKAGDNQQTPWSTGGGSLNDMQAPNIQQPAFSGSLY